jgi:hypothetical protein
MRRGKLERRAAMSVLLSVGINSYEPERLQRVLAKMREHLPDPAVYNGHEYTDCFHVDGEPIIMQKRRDGTVELSLTCDSSTDLIPL